MNFRAPNLSTDGRLSPPIGERSLPDEGSLLASQEKLRQREAELTEFVENASVGLHWVAPDGTIQWANKADYELLGYTAEEYIGRNISEFHAESSVIKDILTRLTRGERIHEYEARLRCKDGSIKTVLIDSCVLWKNGEFMHTQCFTRDITEWKRAEEALRLSSRLPAENPAPVLRLSRERILHFANPAAREFLSEWNVRIGDAAPASILELLEGGHRKDREITIGERCYIVAVVPVLEGEFANLYFTDITKRKRVEEKLRQSEAVLQTELADSKLLQAISAEIVFEPEMEALFEKILDAAVAIMRSEFASMQVFCPERGDGELRLLASRGFEPEALKTWEWVNRQTPSSCGEALRRNSRVIVSDLAQCDFLGCGGLADYQAAGICSMQSTPLFSRGGKLVGMISTHWRKPHEPTERELRLFDIIAREAADVIEQRRAEMLLRESKERYHQLVSLLPAGVYVCDADGRITFYNRKAAELWGLEPETDGDDRFCACYKVFHLDGTYIPPQATPMAIAVREGKTFRNIEARVERPDGSSFIASVNIDPLWNSEGRIQGAINVFQDVTERKQAEEKLRESEQQLAAEAKALARLNSLGSRLWQTPSLREGIEEMLASTIDMLSADMGNIQLLDGDTLRIAAQRGFQQDFLDFFREVSAADDSACGRALRTGARIMIEDVETDEAYASMRDIARSAGYRGVQSTPLIGRDGKARGMISTHWRLPHRPDERRLRHLDLYVRQAADFIERWEIEQVLRENEESAARLAAIVEYSDDAIFSTNLQGAIKSWNRGAEQLYGYTTAEALGQSLAILIPEGRANDEPAILERIRRGESVENYETERRRKDGTVIHVSLTVSPVKDPAGNVTGASKVARDITDKVRARQILEQTVAERTASLREALAQMEEFSYSVSHDLRAPLRAMRAYAGVLLEEYGAKLDDIGRGYLEKIQRGSDRMDRLTQDVLTYSRIARAQVQLEPIAVENLVRDIIHQYAYLQAPAAQIEITAPLLDVLGHETTFGQCVANLLNNAVKFVPAGRTPCVRVGTERRGRNVRVWFEDNGIGIKPEHQDRVFQMFERVHPDGKYEGTGIGLAIVRKAVEKMGGKVGVESDGRNGSRFWIELPGAE